MRPLIQEISSHETPDSLTAQLHAEPGTILLRSALFEMPQARYSFVAARPFLTFRSFGSRCELTTRDAHHVQFGNPWHILDGLMARYEMLEELDLPFPLGGCFGYWGYDLKNFVEPKLPRRASNELELPDCHVGFYDSLVAFDHRLEKTWIISTGLDADGTRSESRAREQMELWEKLLAESGGVAAGVPPAVEPVRLARRMGRSLPDQHHEKSATRIRAAGCPPSTSGATPDATANPPVHSNFTRERFIEIIERAQRYIRSGDIYQVNLAQRLHAPALCSGWELFERLSAVSPAPFSAYLQGGDFQLVSSSPELFLRLSGAQIQTRPIKGTRPRAAEPDRDARLTYELQTSAKEMAELVMITDLLRNDLGRVCEYGSVQVPELVRLERYPQVQHLVSTVEGRLRSDVTHFAALASCFPGGSITGAPKFRAMEIIDELEPITRGPYTGALGYLGFNRESQLSLLIRAATRTDNGIYFHAGAGIVADSIPAAEYDETLAKAAGFLAALRQPKAEEIRSAKSETRTKSE